jgi:hydrogenase nickel incorporation protein HypA/HybF
MHEATIVQSLLDAAVDCLHDNGGKRITGVRVLVGQLSGVVPEALEFAFSCMRKGTPAEDAALEIRFLKAQYLCGSCNGSIENEDGCVQCPFCLSLDLSVSQGFELHLESVEIE